MRVGDGLVRPNNKCSFGNHICIISYLSLPTADRWIMVGPAPKSVLSGTLLLEAEEPDPSMNEDVKENVTRGGLCFFYGLCREKKITLTSLVMTLCKS